ncbi:hypothetical protein PQO01_19500 [Lentisphaera marina]|uniref:hypothetical protein n=1 Tax=Lentisphaera marina TaxID=1111041 RepID=UPI002366B0D8|nr:hypothetical protein [Lentisphaera marina]MDD7987142.1 hypothetical protein [Lentisphaera marina]
MKKQFYLSLLGTLISFLLLAYSILTKTSIMLANLSLGSFFLCFSTAIFSITIYNHKNGGPVIAHINSSKEEIGPGSIQYKLILGIFYFVATIFLIIALSFIGSELFFGHHILKEG